jgi:hypothetical protein
MKKAGLPKPCLCLILITICGICVFTGELKLSAIIEENTEAEKP